jgi:transposase
MVKQLANQIREKIISSYLDGRKFSEIARLYSCNCSTVSRIIKTYLNEGRVKAMLRGGKRPRSLSNEHNEAIRSYIDEDCTISLERIGNRLISEFGINVSINTIARAIKNFSYTLKRVSPTPERRNNKISIRNRYVYAKQFRCLSREIGHDNIFFLDEVGFNVSMRITRGRSFKGEKAVKVVPALRTRNISICCTMSKNGTFFYKKQTCPFNTSTFISYIDELLEKLRECDIRRAIIMMDNVRFHHVASIKDKIISAGHIPDYIPPYSPFLSPIENMFAQWKQLVKRGNPMNENDLLGIIDSSFREISSQHCENYYNHMLNVLEKCFKRQAIDNE